MKVIKGMFDINNLYYILTHLGEIGEITKFYREIIAGISYFGNKIDFIFFIISIGIAFMLKNSMEKLEKINFKLIHCIEINIYFWFGIAFMTKVSQFLYFNF